MRYDYSEVYKKLGDIAVIAPDASERISNVEVKRIPVERGYNFLQFRIHGVTRNHHDSALYLAGYFSNLEEQTSY